MDADGVGMTDGVGELELAAGRQTGGHDVLRHPARHVGRAAIHLGRVLAGEGAAAVTAHAAVGVHNDFAAGQAGVALRSAHDKAAGGVDEELGLGCEQLRRKDFLDDLLDAKFFDLAVLDLRAVLGGDDHVGDGHWQVVLIDDRDLRLRIGAQPRRAARFADTREFPAEPVRKHDRRRHQLAGFVARVAEHQPLVARALLGGLLALGLLGVHALGDVRGLLGDDDIHEHLVGMKHVVVVDIADLADGFAGDGHEVELGLGGDLAAHDGDVGLHVGLAGDAAEPVLRQAGVQHGIGDGVRHLVWMALADGFGGEDITIIHG